MDHNHAILLDIPLLKIINMLMLVL